MNKMDIVKAEMCLVKECADMMEVYEEALIVGLIDRAYYVKQVKSIGEIVSTTIGAIVPTTMDNSSLKGEDE